MKHTYLLIAGLPSNPAPCWTYLKSSQKIFDADCTCTTSYVKLRGYWTESHQISARCIDMTADYYAQIKIVIFQSIVESQGDKWRSSSNCGRIASKIARFSSVNSEIVERKFTKFVHDVAGLLPFNHLKTDLRSANSLSNAKAKYKGHYWRCLQTSLKFNWLPEQRPLGDCQTNIGMIIPTNMPTKRVK